MIHCTVAHLSDTTSFGTDWDAPPWHALPPQRLLHHMGSRPQHFPETEFKIAHDREAISVIFRVKDRYVRAVATRHGDPVYRDSCVEFFFTPGPDPSMGYFNLEMNCGGTMLFHFQPKPRENQVDLSLIEGKNIAIFHSLPTIVNPELSTPVTWSVAYRIPFAVLDRYCPVTRPAPNVIWRGNFHKCADQSSHPHWLTWAPINSPKPNFHLPQYFGQLNF